MLRNGPNLVQNNYCEFVQGNIFYFHQIYVLLAKLPEIELWLL